MIREENLNGQEKFHLPCLPKIPGPQLTDDQKLLVSSFSTR